MKASVQYNDFLGTSAADISDHTNLNEFLKSRGVDIERYAAVGARFYSGYSTFFSPSIICKDNNQSTVEKPHLVSISFESDITVDEFLNLFKRFDVIVTEKFNDFTANEIAEEIMIDDRNNFK